MRAIIVLIAFTLVVVSGEENVFDKLTQDLEQLMVKEEWELFKATHDKQYEDEDEEQFRKEVFRKNFKMINEHNEKYKQGLVTFELGVNSFTDMLLYEITNTMMGASKNLTRDHDAFTFISPANVKLPRSVDWRSKGAVTAVKNQGRCGSCWAFSATGALEGQHFRSTKILVSLSEQNLLDCSTSGCNGGYPKEAFEFIQKNGGIDTESSYKYEAQNASCRFNKKTVGATVKGLVVIPSGNEQKLMEAVATTGPVSVLIDSNHFPFAYYKGGVYYEPKCRSNHWTHAVLIVGYGNENGKDYWLVKNSWGKAWGVNGYIKMARNRQNNCGIADQAVYPLV